MYRSSTTVFKIWLTCQNEGLLSKWRYGWNNFLVTKWMFTNSPEDISLSARSPRFVRAATSARSISPVLRWMSPNSSTIFSAWVPLPAAGGPNRTTRMRSSSPMSLPLSRKLTRYGSPIRSIHSTPQTFRRLFVILHWPSWTFYTNPYFGWLHPRVVWCMTLNWTSLYLK